MMGDLNEWCKHDTLAAYCGDCMIELRAENEALRRDAGAFKLIREAICNNEAWLFDLAAICSRGTYKVFDAAIDAAMKEGK